MGSTSDDENHSSSFYAKAFGQEVAIWALMIEKNPLEKVLVDGDQKVMRRKP